MLGSDLISRANYGHMMAQFAHNASNEANSIEAETDRLLASVHTKDAPGTTLEKHRPVEQSSDSNASSFEEESKDPTKKVGPGGKEFTPEEEKEIEELEKRDAEVKRHEQAHFQAGGKYANSPKYEYQSGPDGKRYAVGGSVDIDMSEVPNDPQATLDKARVVKRAALAPEDPSVQDRKVARQADQMAAEAQRQISEERINSPTAGSAEASEKKPAKSLEELTADGVSQVSTESLEIDPSKHIAHDNVHRFRTSRLQMSSMQSTQTETLASPKEVPFFRGQGISFDHYM
ncbi:MAG: putative metalloprotease CJM1_0395 family protein [Rhodothermales bacterium]